MYRICRRTEQAILQILESAKYRITLVSFAVYRIQNVRNALVRAAQRGVQLTVIVETPDKIAASLARDQWFRAAQSIRIALPERLRRAHPVAACPLDMLL